VSGPLFTAVNAEINNVIYMELNLGTKMADGKYRKTYVAGSVDRENTVLILQISVLNILNVLHNLSSFLFKTPFIS
jgi:hypothetical protein